MGRLDVLFQGSEGRINLYEASLQGQVITSYQLLGNELFGPFYVNPALLSMSSIISIPSIGFSLDVAGRGPNGGVLLVYSLSGVALKQGEYDPATGILLSAMRRNGLS